MTEEFLPGPPCPRCGQETFRLVPSTVTGKKCCPNCAVNEQVAHEKGEVRHRGLQKSAKRHGMWKFGKKRGPTG